MTDSVRQYFESTAPGQPTVIAWRMSCYSAGLELADYVEQRAFQVSGKTVLDVAAGWGGHIIAFAERGAQTVAADLNDHLFGSLARYSESRGLGLRTIVANCERLPFDEATIDVLLALELIEHIDSVPDFAREVARVLKPGGFAILSTPARFKSFFDQEPHFQLRFLTILPLRLQGFVARKLFKRGYPFPITRQYLFASSALKPFRNAGLQGEIRWTGRLARKAASAPVLRRIGEELMFNFLIVKRP